MSCAASPALRTVITVKSEGLAARGKVSVRPGSAAGFRRMGCSLSVSPHVGTLFSSPDSWNARNIFATLLLPARRVDVHTAHVRLRKYLLRPAYTKGRAAEGDAVEVERGRGVFRCPHLQEGEASVHADGHDRVGRLAEPHLDQRAAQVLLVGRCWCVVRCSTEWGRNQNPARDENGTLENHGKSNPFRTVRRPGYCHPFLPGYFATTRLKKTRSSSTYHARARRQSPG